MKKTMIALAVAAITATSVQAAPMEDSFYTGLRAGWVSGHYDINQFENMGSVDRDDVTYGIFGGYQLSKHFGLELGYDYFGKIKTSPIDMRSHGASLSLKGSYPISMVNGLDIYGRLGAAFIRSDYDVNSSYLNNVGDDHGWEVSPIFGAGFEYVDPSWKNLAFNLEYQWINKVGKLDGVDFTPSLGTVTAGVTYRFGQNNTAEPIYIDKTFAMNSDVGFEFNSAKLTKDAQTQLNNIYDYMSQVKSENVLVAGHADRIGSEKENETLSLHRAQNVANYLVHKGVAQDIVSVEHYGAKNPITGTACDGIKDHHKLVACLAPDRRVEIAVRGTKL